MSVFNGPVHRSQGFCLEVPPRFELGVELLQSSALPLGYGAIFDFVKFRAPFDRSATFYTGAADEARTRYLHLGKVALYQMSYARKWCLRSESNQRHADFQSAALPTELQRQMATTKGLEPSTSGVTGRRSNQLNYMAVFWWEQQGSNL